MNLKQLLQLAAKAAEKITEAREKTADLSAGKASSELIDDASNLSSSTIVTPEMAKLNSQVWAKNTSSHLYKARRLWNFAMASLPIDLLFLLLENHTLQGSQLLLAKMETVSLILLIVGILGFFHSKIIKTLREFFLFQQSIQKLLSRFSTILPFLLAAVFISEYLLRIKSGGLLAIIVIGIPTILSIPGILKSSVKNREKFKNNITSPQFIKSFDRFNFLLTIVPVLSTRLASLLAAIALIINHSTTLFLAIFLASLFILPSLAPRKDQFFGNCKRCASLTSQAFSGEFFCPNCLSTKYSKHRKP